MTRKILFVSNQKARRGKSRASQVASLLDAAGLDVFHLAPSPTGNWSERLAEMHQDFEAIVVAGGDGSVNAVLPALVGTQTPLGIIPLGTANNVARTLEIPLDLKSACGVIAAGKSNPIDVGEVNGHYFLTTASLGLSVRITHQLSRETKRRWGRFAYILAAVRVARSANPFFAELRLHGRVIKSRTFQIVVGNGLYYGTKLRVADDAEIDDQGLDVLSLEVTRWWELLRVLPALKKGDHARREEILSLRTRELEVVTRDPMQIDGDGELISSTPAFFRVLPKALHVLKPPETP